MRFLLTLFLVFLVLIGYFPTSLFLRETKLLNGKTQLPGQFIKTEDGPIYYQQVGFQEQPLIVYISGRGGWSENWKPNMSFLAQQGFRGIALDVPPWGLSPDPTSRNYSLKAQAQRIQGAIHNLGLKNFVLVSHAEGAQLALILVSLLPQNIRGLVLLSPDIGLPKRKDQPIAAVPIWVKTSMKNSIARQFAAAVLINPLFTRAILSDSFNNKQFLSAKTLAVYQYPFSFKGAHLKVSGWLFNYLYGKDVPFAKDVHFNAQVTLPTLVVWGEQDAVSPIWQAEALKGWLPQMQLATIKNAGHTPQLEAFATTNDTILKFASQLLTPVRL